MPYRHPGQAFLSCYGMLQSEQDVSRYVEFLRQEAGLSDDPPVDLAPIYSHFGMPTPRRAPLDEQQGILVDSSTGIILNERLRRKRTEYHFATSHTLRGSASLNSAHSDCCASCAPRGGELTRSD